MSKLVWDNTGERFYELGVDRGVLYTSSAATYDKAEAWNGLTAVNESPSGAETSAIYADNTKYGELQSAEEFAATVECYTYPKSFEECDGSVEVAQGVTIGQQTRKSFGFSYRTKVGNDVDGQDHGYKIHLVYGCKAAPSEKSYNTINDNPDANTFSYDFTTTPVPVTGKKPTSHLIVDSRTADPTKLAELEKVLYGDTATEGKLPMPDEVIAMMAAEE